MKKQLQSTPKYVPFAKKYYQDPKDKFLQGSVDVSTKSHAKNAGKHTKKEKRRCLEFITVQISGFPTPLAVPFAEK
jgi:tellurite resistance protein